MEASHMRPPHPRPHPPQPHTGHRARRRRAARLSGPGSVLYVFDVRYIRMYDGRHRNTCVASIAIGDGVGLPDSPPERLSATARESTQV